MRKIFRVVLTSTLILNLSFASIAMAKPENDKFTDVQTSGSEKAKIGEYKGDDTVIIDPLGNETTYGQLKGATNFVAPEASENIENKLLVPEIVSPTFEPTSPITTLSAYGHAWPYTAVNSSSVNCYGYAVKIPWRMNPGDGDNVSNVYDSGYFTNVNYTASLVAADGNTNPLYFKSGWRILSSRTAAVNDDEHRIALRVGWIDYNGDGKVDLSGDIVDYHFMLQNSSGLWSEKHGSTPSQNTAISNPSTFTWSLGGYSGFYNSPTVYIAAKVY